MRDYLLKKYSAYGDEGKIFNCEHIMVEMLCSNSVARLHIKQVLNVQKTNFTKDEFFNIIEVALDLDWYAKRILFHG